MAPKNKYKVTWESFLYLPTIFVGLTLATIQEVDRLEKGEVERVWIFAPLAWIYKLFGYWPTIALPALFGVLCLVALILVYFNERRSAKKKSEPNPNGSHRP